jgi:hypothetical protein
MWILKYYKDFLDNLNYRYFAGNFVCPIMQLFYTLQTVPRGNASTCLTISFNTHLFLKW